MDRLGVQAGCAVFGFGLPQLREAGFGAFYPCGFLEVAQLMIFPAQGTVEDHALDQLALLGHEVARWFAERGLVALRVAHEDAAIGPFAPLEHSFQRSRLIPGCQVDAQQVRSRSSALVGSEHDILGNAGAFDLNVFDPDIQRAGIPGRRYAGFHQSQEFVEDRVLHGDRQCQYAVEPAPDGREFFKR